MKCFVCYQDFSEDELEYKNGRYGVCHSCIAKKSARKPRNLKQKQARNQYAYDQRDKRRKLVSEYKLSYGCAKCGYNTCSTALHLHHKDSKDKTNNISRMITQGYGIGRVIEEMRKCEVLCANCHAELHSADGEAQGA
jgi:hypothetical protein